MSRFNPLESYTKKKFLSLGNKEYMKSDDRTRLYDDKVSWDGGDTLVQFNWESMIDIEFYLANIRIDH